MHATTTLERPTRQAIAFEVAKTQYEQADAEFSRLWALYEAADEAMRADCPRVDRYFDEYGLGVGMSRDGVVFKLGIYAAAQGSDFDVEAAADEFMAYQERALGSRRRYRLNELMAAADAYGDSVYFPARDKLMSLPAPDASGLLAKLQIAAVSCDDEHVASCLADARRLLAADA